MTGRPDDSAGLVLPQNLLLSLLINGACMNCRSEIITEMATQVVPSHSE